MHAVSVRRSFVILSLLASVACGGGDSSDDSSTPGGGNGSGTGGKGGSGGSSAGSGGSAGAQAGGKGGSTGSGGKAGNGGTAGSSAGTTGDGGAAGDGQGGDAGSGNAGAGGSDAGAGGEAGAGNAGAGGEAGAGGATGCVPGSSQECYSGPDGTKGVGLCKAGAQKCLDDGTFGLCEGEVVPAAESCATPEDDNCDGQANEGCSCTPGTEQACYNGPAGKQGVGLCKAGIQKCLDDGSGYGACEGEVVPAAETCATPDDEDCDGQANEEGAGCACVPGSTAPCYSGPAGTENVGICKGGTQTCNAEGTGYGACEGEVLPGIETCDAGLTDEDCDGQTNEEGAGCACLPGSTAPCYDGPNGTQGVGICKAGIQTCAADGSGYGSCEGQTLPDIESCTVDGDEDCDGQANEEGVDCVCVPGSTAPCYDGPNGTQGVGICKGGTQTCLPSGTGYGACEGQVLPAAETCDAGLTDEDCDGQTNEEGAGCACLPGSTAPCYDGPNGTQGVGICKGGTKTCSLDGTSYGSCEGQTLPATESCVTVADDDCNGQNLVCNAANQDCNPNTGQCEDACSPALLGNSYVGCVYYPTVTANVVATNFNFAVAISNTSNKVATVTITKGGAAVSTVNVAANSVQTVNLPWVNNLKGGLDVGVPVSSVRENNGAYKLVSNRPVTVYQYSPLQYQSGGAFSYTNDASLLLPVNAWTGKYRVVSRQHWVYSANPTLNYAGTTAIIASQSNTVVKLTPGPQGGNISGTIAGLNNKGSGTITLNEGDVLQLATANGNNDLTGMEVSADKPVQVIGGHQCTFIPANSGYCDHLEESMFPVETLATEYLITAPLIPNGNTPKAQFVRVVATQPNTTLTYEPAQAGFPASIPQAGGWVELPVTANSFKISANAQILVAQYMQGQTAGGNSGDPAMALAVATYQYRTNYLFHAPTNYEKNFVNITAPTGIAVQLDGVAVAANLFTAIGASGFSVARVQLPNTNGGNHTISSTAQVGISVYGYGQYTSYWYPGGLDLKTFL